MTRHPDPGDQAAHHWLTQHQHALTHALDDLLDTAAGLREVLLQSHHDTATSNLDTVLDTEAGLAAILPTPPAPTAHTPHHPTETRELLHTLCPADRMILRNNPEVKAASQALALDHVLDRARAFDLTFDLACELTVDLERAIERAVAVHLDHDLAVHLDLAQTVAADLELARHPNRNRDRAFDLVVSLTVARDRVVDHDLARDLDFALARARDLARAFDVTLDLDLDVGLVCGVIVEIRTAEVGRAIGLALGREPLVLDRDSLHGLLDDFTTSDLSSTDLTGVDLSGVHWSEHTTHWPPGSDPEGLKSRSDESPPGSGVWIVRSGTATELFPTSV
ncbi:hypothetical protein [Streptomyces adustus]|uniref:hypothetical protein n=1 Tax=Streptomyces adustus TaxID=1609272 RepID=UPI001EE3F1B4|nr:hypothetical protein [Streptomyces adustus]